MKIPANPKGMKRIMPNDPIPAVQSDDEPLIRETLSRDPSEPASNLGREVPGNPDVDDDEKADLERIVEEGVEGAQDDQERAARARRDV
jgi:hypothetical protein